MVCVSDSTPMSTLDLKQHVRRAAVPVHLPVQIMKSLRNFTHVMKVATVVGLLQPQPEAFGLFDEVGGGARGRVGSACAATGSHARIPRIPAVRPREPARLLRTSSCG